MKMESSSLFIFGNQALSNVLTLGEIMLRLSTNTETRLSEIKQLQVHYGKGSLRHRLDSTILTSTEVGTSVKTVATVIC
ncbi:hypothetical protein [Shimazuella alba]|uniref:hypothetical protein n=1 Tax=Shimazuella alba TaxID=2690964 RepID=UPI0019251E63|nr:hypothetical protein [Shimazuella alba]